MTDDFPEIRVAKEKAQTAEGATCGRVALVLCGICHVPENEPTRYTPDEVEDMILRWCGFPERTIENVRHAFKMEATGGIDKGPK